jgi:UPF0755 protein
MADFLLLLQAMKPNKRLIFFLLFSVLGISFTYYAFQIVYTPNVLVGMDAEAKVLIVPEGATFKDIQQRMREGHYINDLLSFSFMARIMGYDKAIKPGRYVLRRNMTNLQLVRILKSGKQEPVRITFNNVRLVHDLSEKITRNLAMKPEEFEAGLVQYAMQNDEGFNKDNVMALFIPNTYEVYYNVSARELIERMEGEYKSFWTAERKAKAAKLGLTPVEVSILASIVQAETIKADEAPVIAGLYINRLKHGMPLQADPTLVFAVGDFSLKRVLNEHKIIDSPYNTYLHTGLPPGPINMPEIRSIDAVLNYVPSDYFYMCAKEDFSGYHNFTHNYAEHMKNAAKYQAALTREQRKAALLKR